MQEPPSSILFISLSCVGDAVMTTPVLEALHACYPGAVIDIVSDSRSDVLYKHCPYKGKTFLKNKNKFLRGAVEVLQLVRKKHYDLIVDLRTDGLAYMCRGRKRLTKWDRKPYGNHAVEQLLGIVRTVFREREIPKARVWLTDMEKDKADLLLSKLPEGKWLVFAPGNANEKKIWPTEKYAALANNFSDVFSGVILDGSSQERNHAAEVGRRLNLPFINLAGKTSLLDAAAVLKRASLFIGSDSGLGHIAAAVSTPTLTFFSVDSPERVLPWGSDTYWLASPDEYTCNISLGEAVKMTSKIIEQTIQ